VVVLLGAHVVVSLGIKEVIGAPKQEMLGVLVVAPTLLCCKMLD
jgi:hypothetical protein